MPSRLSLSFPVGQLSPNLILHPHSFNLDLQELGASQRLYSQKRAHHHPMKKPVQVITAVLFA